MLNIMGSENINNFMLKFFVYLNHYFLVQVSEVIIEEEDEQVNVDRNIDEIDEQM